MLTEYNAISNCATKSGDIQSFLEFDIYHRQILQEK